MEKSTGSRLSNSQHIYKLRPGYGSKELLMEFVTGPESESFTLDLMDALDSLNITQIESADLWMNDERLYTFNTDYGEFMMTIDIWDTAFIMLDNNQELINTIDKLLEKHQLFKKEEVDFNDYERK